MQAVIKTLPPLTGQAAVSHRVELGVASAHAEAAERSASPLKVHRGARRRHGRAVGLTQIVGNITCATWQSPCNHSRTHTYIRSSSIRAKQDCPSRVKGSSNLQPLLPPGEAVRVLEGSRQQLPHPGRTPTLLACVSHPCLGMSPCVISCVLRAEPGLQPVVDQVELNTGSDY